MLGQGYVGSAWGRRATPAPAKPAPPVAPRTTARSVTAATSVVRVAPVRSVVIPYYDPSRVVKNIRVVSDLRQSGADRGEVQSGDSGMLGPGSIAPPQTETPGTPGPAGAPGKNNLVPIALAVAAFILLGG